MQSETRLHVPAVVKIEAVDLSQVLADLHAERDAIDEAIAMMERLASSGVRRRGRPPEWMSAITPQAPTPAKKKRGRPKKQQEPLPSGT